MNNDELYSQLSAMFDGELPAPECELLARRLGRDDLLKARWGRYAAIGAAMRLERGVRLHGQLARRVSSAVAAEPAMLVGSSPAIAGRLAGPRLIRWWQPVAGAAVAASVAAAAILWLRAGSPDAPIIAASPMIASASASTSAADTSDAATGSDSYVVPPSVEGPSAAPPTELADFVVAHSEFSMPLLRRSALTSLVSSEAVSDSADAARRAGSTRSDEDRKANADPTH
ncbi:MAG TPA: sigma-E factor negative regulatory protein [Steroidobacteraceae bacterium]|nr:sigma-E factor negative regulatory protein [Steroidobacteraceae bacterium]